MSSICCVCHGKFKKHRNRAGHNAYSLDQCLFGDSNTTIYEALVDSNMYQGPCFGYLCSACRGKLCYRYQKNAGLGQSTSVTASEKRPLASPLLTQRNKRIRYYSPMLNASPLLTSTPRAYVSTGITSKHKNHKKRTQFITRLVASVSFYKYGTAFRLILAKSQSARIALHRLVQSTVRAEMLAYLQSPASTEFPVLKGLRDIEQFSWSTILNHLSTSLPTLHAALVGALPCSTARTIERPFEQRLGLMMTIPLFSHRPNKLSFIQALNGVQMWRSGASHELFKCFNSLGVCQGIQAVRRKIDLLSAENDSILDGWKKLLVSTTSGVAGWWKPQVISEVINNRTVNIHGGAGHNVAMDRVCEFQNAQFKETLKYAHGQYTDSTIQRCGKIVGNIGRAIDSAYHANIGKTSEFESYRYRHDYTKDVRMFIEDYKEEKLFDNIPGRKHKSYPDFCYPVKITDPAKLKARLMLYSKKLDRTRKSVF